MFDVTGGDWRNGFEYAWQAHDPEPDEDPGVTWRQTPRQWSGSWNGKLHGTITAEADGRGRLRTSRGPARAVVDHNGRSVLDC
jgi:hypothetical protein